MSLVCVDGTVVPAAEACIPVTDPGLLRGDGVFEVVRLYDGRPFALDEHLERMQRSADGLRLALDVEAVREDVDALLAAVSPGDGALRVLVTRGGRRVALLEPLPPRRTATRLALVTYSPDRILDGIKSLSYAGNMLALRLAQEQACDDALLVTPHGRVLEAPTATIFYVLDGRLCTPALAERVLDSITRRRLMEVMEVAERPLAVDELEQVTEAFLASTTREVEAVGSIGERQLSAPGPRTAEAARLLSERVQRELAAA